MKVVAFNGSPKGEHSNTQVMIEALLQGLESETTEVFNIFLSQKNINYCSGCYTCWHTTPGRCIHQDDMQGLIELMADTDLFLFGSPLYFTNISGTLKVFFDRLTAAGGDPHKQPAGPGAVKTPHCIMVSNCGFPYRSQFDVISLWINRVSSMMQFKLIGEFYTTNGRVLTQPAVEQQESRKRYLAFLQECGKQYLGRMELEPGQRALLGQGILDF